MKIKSIRKNAGKQRVYNVGVEKNNNYFANGVLTHNCFAYFFKSNNPGSRGKPMPLKSANINNLIHAVQGNPKTKRDRAMYEHFYKRRFLLHWGGLGDPFCGFEYKNKEGMKLIQVLGECNYPTLFSFKGPTIMHKDYIKLFEKYAGQGNFAFQGSIITNSDELSRRIEVGVPPTSMRLEAVKRLSEMGYWTILRLRPFVMGVSDQGLEELLYRAKEAGVNGLSTEWYAMDSRATPEAKRRYKWLAELMGVRNLHQYFSKLSPSERGGYMRLNRKVKEESMKIMYKFCSENDVVCAVSDPDYKELNTSGSCCGMPDHFPKNPRLENWTKNQLTYHLKEMRRKYHTTGESALLHFDDVYREETYFDDPGIMEMGGAIGLVGLPTGVRKTMTHKILLRQHWNNLGSPSNPRNYLHGKLMPIGVDTNGSFIYQYTPKPYEARWASEGIDMTR